MRRIRRGLASMILPCALILSTATAAAADRRPPIRLYQSGESLTVQAAEIDEARVGAAANTPTLVFRFSDTASDMFHTFTAKIVGQQIVGVFDGVVWISDITVREPIAGGNGEIR